MIYIDLRADLNFEDDEGRNIARLSDAVDVPRVQPGAVLVAGRPDFWSWVKVTHVDDGYAYFHQITAREAASLAPLILPLPRPA